MLLTADCSSQFTTINQKKPYTAKGFAYIYNNLDFEKKMIKGRMNNDIMQISHQNLRTGTLIKIINVSNNKSIVLKNTKRVNYPDFYKVLITKPVAEKLEIDLNLPLIEIIEIKKINHSLLKKQKFLKKKKKYLRKHQLHQLKFRTFQKINQKVLPLPQMNYLYS